LDHKAVFDINYFFSLDMDSACEIVSLLISRTLININAQNYQGRTLLRLACAGGQTELAKLLLDNNADPNIKCKDGLTALSRSVILNTNATILMLLSNKNINVNLADNTGNTALHNACLVKNMEALCLLLHYGVDSTIKNNDGLTAFELCAKDKIKMLKNVIKSDQIKKIPETILPKNIPHFKAVISSGSTISEFRPVSKYQTYNNILKCWNDSQFIPVDFEGTCDYSDGKIQHYIGETNNIIVRFPFVVPKNGGEIIKVLYE